MIQSTHIYVLKKLVLKFKIYLKERFDKNELVTEACKEYLVFKTNLRPQQETILCRYKDQVE